MKTVLLAALTSLAAFGLVGNAFATEASAQKYFGINGFYVDPDTARGTGQDGLGADVLFGLQLTGPLYAEARAFGAILETGRNGGADHYNGGASLDLHVLLGKRGRLAAFALAGLGFAYNDVQPNSNDGGALQANAGVGLLSRGLTSAKIRLRLEARAVYEDFLAGVTDFRLGMGLEIPIDAAELVIREVPVERAVEASPGPEVYPSRPVDSDNDGVLDPFDVCPGTLPGTKVDRSGCALAAQSVAMQGVGFETGSSQLTPDSLKVLDRAVLALRGQSGMRVLIAGHTDSIGSATYNKNLSLARAKSVKQYLTSQGIAPSRLDVAGFGEEQPIESNDTEAGRRKNRRVEFQLNPVEK